MEEKVNKNKNTYAADTKSEISIFAQHTWIARVACTLRAYIRDDLLENKLIKIMFCTKKKQ